MLTRENLETATAVLSSPDAYLDRPDLITDAWRARKIAQGHPISAGRLARLQPRHLTDTSAPEPDITPLPWGGAA